MPVTVCASCSQPGRSTHGPFVAVAVDRGVHQAGSQRGELLRAEAAPRERAAAVALGEDVGALHERAQPLGVGGIVEIQVRRALAVTRVHHERRDEGQLRRADPQHVGAVRGERAPAGRPGEHAGEIERADSRQRPRSRRQRLGRASPMRITSTTGRAASARPCGCSAHSAAVRTRAPQSRAPRTRPRAAARPSRRSPRRARSAPRRSRAARAPWPACRGSSGGTGTSGRRASARNR